MCIKDIAVDVPMKPHASPIYATSSFSFESLEDSIQTFKGEKQGHAYSRYGNPGMDGIAEKIAKMETHGTGLSASGIMLGSGMAAISTLALGLLEAGDKILTQGNLYGGTTELFVKILGKFGIETIFCDLRDLDKVAQLLRNDRRIKLLYFETPANPTLACVDIGALCRIAAENGTTTAADNTFCTPYLQQPLQHGTDFVIHSTTKYLNGHGNSIAGCIVGKEPKAMKRIWQCMKLLGTNCNAFDAWLTNNGIKTLELRMDRHSQNAQATAEFLEKHPMVQAVNYNGLASHPDHALAKRQMRAFGGMLSFDLGQLDTALRFVNALEFCTLAPTLGDVDTLVLHPATSSHLNVPKEQRERSGITDGLVRLSVGLESIEDIIKDIDQALERASK